MKETAPTTGPSPAPPVDAGTPAGRGAAGSGAAGASGGGGSAGDAADGGTDPVESIDYSCETDADCAIKNVGNCCGYFPRCVNKDRPVPPFVCPPGATGVCGWPEIDRCSCTQKTCRSLQGGKEV